MWLEEEKSSLLGKVASWVQPDTQYPPVWVDDEYFDIDYHVRHTSLPHPGSDEQLKTLVGHIMSQQLDRSKPLWEVHIIEGMADGGFPCARADHLAALLKVPNNALGEPLHDLLFLIQRRVLLAQRVLKGWRHCALQSLIRQALE